MTIEAEIAALTTATTSLLGAVNVAKSTLDTKVSDASASALAAQSAKVAAEATINVISFTAPENVTVDHVVIAGDLIGIAANTATTGQALSVKRQGVFDMPKVAGEVFAVGGPVYWNKTTKVYTNVSTGNVLIGAATVAAIAGEARVNFALQLNGARTVSFTANPVTGGISLLAGGVSTALAMPGADITVAHLAISKTASNADAPELHYLGKSGGWFTGIDVANHGGGCDFVLAGRIRTNHTMDDLIYLNFGDGLLDPATIGYAFTPPPNLNYRHWFAAADTLNSMGGIAVRVGPSQTGKAFSVIDSNAVDKLFIDKDFTISGENGLTVRQGPGAQVLTMSKADLGTQYGFQYSGNTLVLRYQTGSVPICGFNTNGLLQIYSRQTIGGASDDGASSLRTNNNIGVANAGYGFRTKEGSNAKQGVVTLVSGSSVVSNTSVTENSRIFITSQADGGTPGFLRVSARSAGASFTITSGSGSDASTVAYEIFEPA